MSAIGRNLVPLQTQWLIKKDRKLHYRGPVNYKNAVWIGILYSVQDRAKHDAITNFVERLQEEDKKVEVMTFLGKNKDNYDFKYDFFSAEHISLLGKINAPSVKEFVQKKFDLLFYLDYEQNQYLEPVLVLSQAKCRVGRLGKETKRELFELMIKTEMGSITHLIEQLHHYTKIFAANES